MRFAIVVSTALCLGLSLSPAGADTTTRIVPLSDGQAVTFGSDPLLGYALDDASRERIAEDARLTAGQQDRIRAQVVNDEGIVRARRIDVQDGRIRLLP